MPGRRAKGAKKKVRSRSRQLRICSNCGSENPLGSSERSVCRKSRLEPEWVPGHRPINRQGNVQVTTSNPQHGDVRERMTPARWWRGGHAAFHVPRAEQRHSIAPLIDGDLAPMPTKPYILILTERHRMPPSDAVQRVRVRLMEAGVSTSHRLERGARPLRNAFQYQSFRHDVEEYGGIPRGSP